MSYYPRSLQYTLKQLNGYSRQKFKLLPNISQSQTLGAGATIIVPLPENTIVDLDTFQWFFKGKASQGNAFPKHIESIIYRLAVEINGQIVDDGFEAYNLLFRRFADMTLGDKETIRGVLQNGLGLASLGSNVDVAEGQYAIWNWLGWLQTVQPRCIDTSLLGTVRLHITLANSDILVNDGYNATKSYTITDNYFTVDTIQIQDGVYYSVLNERLNDENNPIELPFQTFTHFSSGVSSLAQTLNATLNTESLDMLIGTYQDSNWANNGSNAVLKASSYFKTGSSNITGSQFAVNNSPYPPFSQAPHDAFANTLNALNLSQDVLGQCDATLSNLTNWRNNAFMHCLRLNHPTAQDERVKSGLNLRGTNSVISWTTTGTESSVVPHMFAGHTSVLVVKPYKQLAVIR